MLTIFLFTYKIMYKKGYRLAIVNSDRCKPKKCNKECTKKCPPQQAGKKCIEIENIAKISESICIGCSMCEKLCPFDAIQIVNLPNELPAHIMHRYGFNGFRLYKFPILRKNKVSGILGQNGIGKSTVVKILSGSIKPNFEKDDLPDSEILLNFKGNEISKYFKELYAGKIKLSVKSQNIEDNSEDSNKNVLEYIKLKCSNLKYEFLEKLDISEQLLKTPYFKCSGGEQQRIQCCITMMQDADMYIFDEPTNYLDIRQRLKVAECIRLLVSSDRYVVVIDHDITILDYVADQIYMMYGTPAAYGVVSMPHSTAGAINMYFDGYIPSENMRFRPESYSYGKNLELRYEEDITEGLHNYPYSKVDIDYEGFKLSVDSGSFPSHSAITLILGENGTGKTTFIKSLLLQLELNISYKPQYPNISKLGKYSVMQFLTRTIKSNMSDSMFISDVIKPLGVKNLYDKKIKDLSGGELQKVAIVACLGKDAHVYILDEPSASLDIEQRFNIIKVLKRFIVHNRKIAFVVEHDITMGLSIAQETNSQIIVFEHKETTGGTKYCHANSPMTVTDGMNKFLSVLDVTFRKSSKFDRPRINRNGSGKDREQKAANIYYMG